MHAEIRPPLDSCEAFGLCQSRSFSPRASEPWPFRPSSAQCRSVGAVGPNFGEPNCRNNNNLALGADVSRTLEGYRSLHRPQPRSSNNHLDCRGGQLVPPVMRSSLGPRCTLPVVEVSARYTHISLPPHNLLDGRLLSAEAISRSSKSDSG